jgi:hypothetical protein
MSSPMVCIASSAVLRKPQARWPSAPWRCLVGVRRRARCSGRVFLAVLQALIGDGLVLTASGAGRNPARRIGFDDANGLHLPGANHFTLLNHDEVYAALRRWLAGESGVRALGVG